ncbi:MAG: polyphosphate:AMP phosphotransferase [Leptolyngbya sp. SIO1E4]|nr:polyphosphate:AMP phosphotransferase [Leptolyngbya sp. SIO1E4]
MFEAVELGHKISKQDYSSALPQLRVELVNAQYELCQAPLSMLILLMGDDRQSCNEVINHLGEWMDGRYIHNHFFGELTDEERERPRFWRYWRRLPQDGMTGVFVGAWALNTIAERLRNDISDKSFYRRCHHIYRFENMLAANGVLLLKFWFHQSKKDFKHRLKAAQKDPKKAWRIDEAEWQVYEQYEDFVSLSERYIRLTSSGITPWTLVETTCSRYRNLIVMQTISSALETRLAEPNPPPSSEKSPTVYVNQSDRSVLDTLPLKTDTDWKAYREVLETYQARLKRLTRKARRAGVSSILVFEGWDAAGKGGVIRRLTQAMDAQDYRVIPIGAPTDEEKAHHYLWRFWQQVPRNGKVVVFDRSWYGRILVERVEGFAQSHEWQWAYSEINDFEEQLHEHGILMLKFWLHIDPDEQLRRFKAREQTPYKKYKITEEDYRNRDRWQDYEVAVTDMVSRTSTRYARWHLIPSNDKRHARIEVIKTFCESLEKRL